ncbi:MAG: hypothetical protein NZ556_01300 [Fimbriimonadales bacterium]|nr:hypothetical protein [Fimbriimonadales bacterium]
MMNCSNCRRTAGRASCWLLGGIGCLGLMLLLMLGVYWVARSIEQSGLGQAARVAAESEQKLRPRLAAIAKAINEYARDHNGKYPPNLKALVPKYLTNEAIAPVALKDGTKYEFVYRPPKPNDPPDTVILEHKPPVKVVASMLGETVEVQTTYRVGKDGIIRERTETITSAGRRVLEPDSSEQRR